MKENKILGRVLALDIGSARVGAAISDPSRVIAQGIGVWKTENFLEDFKSCIEKYDPSLILIGLPKRTDGTYGPECENIFEFLKILKENYPERIFQTWDERFTTVIAQRVLIEADVSRKRRKKNIDKLAAVLILESWLEYQSINKN